MTAPIRVYVRPPKSGVAADVASVPVWPDGVEYIRADVAQSAIVLAAVAASGGITEDRMQEIMDFALRRAAEACA